MDLESVVASLAETPYSLEVTEATLPTLRALLDRAGDLQERYESVHRRFGQMIRNDPEFRAYQTFHSNKLELQGPDLRTTQTLIEEFVRQGEPDDLRVFGAIHSVLSDAHLLDVLGQHQANILVERIATDFSDDRPFTESDLRAINSFCIQDKSFAGEYRKSDRLNIGQFFEDDDPLWFARELDHAVEVKWFEIPDHMRAICAFISKSQVCPPLAAAVAHAWFTHVHPFHDGNGRTARLIANLVLIRNAWPPITITKGKRDEYLDALSESDVAGDIRLLFELFTDSISLNLSEFEDERYWRKRYQLELQQNNQQRVNNWIGLAREFVRLARGFLRQDGWVFERVSMPDAPTFLLLEDGESRAATLFGKIRHPDKREIRVGIGYMSDRLKQATDFDSSLDEQHYPPTLYLMERDFRPEADYPYVHRKRSRMRVREFTFLPGVSSRAIYLYGTVEPTPLESSIEGLCAVLVNDIEAFDFPGYRDRYGHMSLVADQQVVAPDERPRTNSGVPAASISGRYALSIEMAQAASKLEEEVNRRMPTSWNEVLGLLVELIAEGKCLARSLELDGVLFSTLGTVVRPLLDSHPGLGPRPERIIDHVLDVIEVSGYSDLQVVASRDPRPHPTLVHRDRKYGRQLWVRQGEVDS